MAATLQDLKNQSYCAIEAPLLKSYTDQFARRRAIGRCTGRRIEKTIWLGASGPGTFRRSHRHPGRSPLTVMVVLMIILQATQRTERRRGQSLGCVSLCLSRRILWFWYSIELPNHAMALAREMGNGGATTPTRARVVTLALLLSYVSSYVFHRVAPVPGAVAVET